MADAADNTLKHTPLRNHHITEGARLVPFAGYEMPVSFIGGIAEHNHVRTAGCAGIFDVSHMGQITLSGANVSHEFEKLVPSQVTSLEAGKSKYTVLMNKDAGIIDDLIMSKNTNGSLSLVVNGSRKYDVLAHLSAELNENITITHHEDRALVALQGEAAMSVLASHNPYIGQLKFMSFGQYMLEGFDVIISRTGYTGEDGFEISCKASSAEALYKMLLTDKRVKPIGLGARDTLRLEAGLCLYGQDLNETTTPLEAGLSWIISHQKTGDNVYIGANIIAEQKVKGISKIRVGLKPEGRAPVRAGTEIYDADNNLVGTVTSGSFSPTLDAPISMGYVAPDFKENGTKLFALLRGKHVPIKVTLLPFVAHRYVR